MPIYKCPTRRGGTAVNNDVNMPGPLKDYTATTLMNAANSYYHGQGPDTVSLVVGPFRHAVVTTSGDMTTAAGKVESWSPRDDMSWWTDGSSNEVIFAETHIPQDHLGLCKEHNGAPNITRAQMSDCSYLSSRPEKNPGSGNTEWRTWTVVRSVGGNFNGTTIAVPTPIAKSPNEYAELGSTSWQTYGFGSYHSGVFNITLGDGSVRSCSNAVKLENLARLIQVNDGQSAELP